MVWTTTPMIHSSPTQPAISDTRRKKARLRSVLIDQLTGGVWNPLRSSQLDSRPRSVQSQRLSLYWLPYP